MITDPRISVHRVVGEYVQAVQEFLRSAGGEGRNRTPSQGAKHQNGSENTGLFKHTLRLLISTLRVLFTDSFTDSNFPDLRLTNNDWFGSHFPTSIVKT